MSERQDTLQQYVSDMLAVEKHILEPIERQTDDDRVKKNAQVNRLLNQLKSTLKHHISALEQHLKSLGGDAASPVKDAVTNIAGVAAGLYDKVRTDTVSKMLRDDYTALSLDAIAYTMLHTTGLALNDFNTADIALQHLQDLTPIIVEISEVIPLVVVAELRDEAESVNMNAGQEAVRNTQQAWNRENTEQGPTNGHRAWSNPVAEKA